MKYTFEVKRERYSTTQGEAVVYLNGEEMIRFADTIELVDGIWKSVKKDEDFIKGLLFHPLDNVYHYSDKVKKVLERTYSTKEELITLYEETLNKFKKKYGEEQGPDMLYSDNTAYTPLVIAGQRLTYDCKTADDYVVMQGWSSYDAIVKAKNQDYDLLLKKSAQIDYEIYNIILAAK